MADESVLDGIIEELNVEIPLFPGEQKRKFRKFNELKKFINKEVEFWRPLDSDQMRFVFLAFQGIQSFMIALFGLFAEVERDLISERTKEGLAAAKAQGKLLGRPKGALGKSRLDGKEQDIRVLLGKNVSKASIAKILDVSRSALYHFIETRKIVPS